MTYRASPTHFSEVHFAPERALEHLKADVSPRPSSARRQARHFRLTRIDCEAFCRFKEEHFVDDAVGDNDGRMHAVSNTSPSLLLKAVCEEVDVCDLPLWLKSCRRAQSYFVLVFACVCLRPCVGKSVWFCVLCVSGSVCFSLSASVRQLTQTLCFHTVFTCCVTDAHALAQGVPSRVRVPCLMVAERADPAAHVALTQINRHGHFRRYGDACRSAQTGTQPTCHGRHIDGR